MINFILFALSTIGYVLFSCFQLKLHFKLSWFFSVIIQIFILLIFSLLNVLSLGINLTFILGIILAVFYSVRFMLNKDIIKTFKIDIISVLFAVFVCFSIFIIKDIPLIHNDNFSHWGLVVKYLFTEQHLPDENTLILNYASYPPGLALYIDYFLDFVGYSEGKMAVGNFFVNIAAIFGVFSVIRRKNDYLSILILLFLFALMFKFDGYINIYGLPVDNLLSFATLFGIAGLWVHRKNFTQLSIIAISTAGILPLIKSSGQFLGIIILLIYLFFSFEFMKIERKKYIPAALFTVAISNLPTFLWNEYVSKNINLDNFKHAFNMELNDREAIELIIKNFIDKSIDIISFTSWPWIMIIAIMITVLLITANDYKLNKSIWFVFISLFSVSISYYIGLLVMYITSMPFDESIKLASFSRYVFTMLFVALGTLGILLTQLMEHYHNYIDKNKMNLIGIALILAATVLMIGKSDYEDSKNHINEELPKSMATSFRDLNIDNMDLNTHRYLVIGEGNSALQYVPRYYLYSPHTKVFDKNSDTKESISDYDFIVILDKHENTVDASGFLFNQILAPGIYSLNEIDR